MKKFKLSMADVSEGTGEAMPLIYAAIKAGDLKTFLVGRRRFARPEAVQAWVDYLQAESDKGRPVCYQAREKEAA